MICSALLSKPLQGNEKAVDFVTRFFDSARCENPAVYLGPGGSPLCQSCGQRRKKDHEEGLTILSIIQQSQFGKILPYSLRPLPPANTEP